MFVHVESVGSVFRQEARSKQNSGFLSSFIGKSVCDESPCLSLQECQRKLDHKLGLDSYLLKPVQRLTKYQLLLKVLFIRASQSWRGLQRCSAHNHTRRKDLIRNNNNLRNKSFVQKSEKEIKTI